MKVLVNLVSGQNAPNFFAYKLIKPEKIINVYSSGSIRQKQWLESSVKDVLLEDVKVDAFDYDDCRSKFREIIKDNIFNETILNFTNGTKIMSVAGFETFKENNLLSVYIDSERMFLIKLRGDILEKEPFSVNLSLKEYFSLYGNNFNVEQKILSDEEKSEKKRFIEFIAEYYNRLSPAFIKLASLNEKEQKSFSKSKEEICKKGISISSSANSIVVNIKNNKIPEISFEFKGDKMNSIGFITGKWYEEYIFNTFLKENIFSDLLSNLDVKYQDVLNNDFSKNEIDIAGIRNNTLYIFEIKSGNVNQDHLNKLRTLKDYLGGRYSKPILISYFPQKTEITERAKEYGIEFINHKKINELITNIKTSNSNIHL